MQQDLIVLSLVFPLSVSTKTTCGYKNVWLQKRVAIPEPVKGNLTIQIIMKRSK